jgi:tricorn protease-like protein
MSPRTLSRRQVVGMLPVTGGCGQRAEPTEPGKSKIEHLDREVPRPKAVSASGVRYETMRNARMRGFTQSGGVILATSVKSKAELWTLQVYAVPFDPAEERDVQEVYITELKVDASGKRLMVTNENGERFAVDLDTHAAATPVPK